MRKVYSKGNYIVYENNSSILDRVAKQESNFLVYDDKYIVKSRLGSASIEIKKAWITDSELYKSDGVTLWTFSDIEDFFYENTGFSLAGSSAVPTTGKLVYVESLSNLPDAVAGVITLLPEVTYYFLGDIDLLGARLVGSQDTVILGSSSENSSITSTGLGASEYLFSTNFTTPIRHITFKDHTLGIGVNISNTGAQPIALDWYGVNFLNLGTSLVCGDIDNFVFNVGAILNGGSFVFIGSVGTIGIANSIFVGDGTAQPLIQVTSAATVTRRFRVIYSAFVAFGSTEAIDVEVGATVPIEGFILDTCNFSGGGNYLPSVDHTSNESLFTNNVGITNSSDVSNYYMNGNATATVIATQGVAVKVAGATTSGAVTSKFTNTDNRSTYNGVLQKAFKIVCTTSVESGNNNQIGVYIAKNGVLIGESEVYGTTSGSGRAENIVVQTLTTFQQGDYIEVWVENNTGTQNIVVTDLNLIID